MKFLSFRAGGGARYGVADGSKVIDLSARLKYPDLKALITAGARAEAEREAKGAAGDFNLDQIVFDPVIPNAPICPPWSARSRRRRSARPRSCRSPGPIC